MRDRALREGGNGREDGCGRGQRRDGGDRAVRAWRRTLPLADCAGRPRVVVRATGRRGDDLPAVLHPRGAAAHQRVDVHELR